MIKYKASKISNKELCLIQACFKKASASDSKLLFILNNRNTKTDDNCIEHNIVFIVLHCPENNVSQMFDPCGPCGQGQAVRVSRLSLPKAKEDPNSEIHSAGCGTLAARSAHPARWRANHRNSMQLDPLSQPCLSGHNAGC